MARVSAIGVRFRPEGVNWDSVRWNLPFSTSFSTCGASGRFYLLDNSDHKGGHE